MLFSQYVQSLDAQLDAQLEFDAQHCKSLPDNFLFFVPKALAPAWPILSRSISITPRPQSQALGSPDKSLGTEIQLWDLKH